MSLRESVSPEAIQRAIRGRLLIAEGLDSAAVAAPLQILEDEAHDHYGNWRVDAQLIPPELREPVHAAAARVAEGFRLRSRRRR